MNGFDGRGQALAAQGARDEGLGFRARVRRDRKLGLWAAGLLGKRGGCAEEYAQSLIAAEIEGAGRDALIGKLLNDFRIGRVARSDHQIRSEMERCLAEAEREVRAA